MPHDRRLVIGSAGISREITRAERREGRRENSFSTWKKNLHRLTECLVKSERIGNPLGIIRISCSVDKISLINLAAAAIGNLVDSKRMLVT